MRKAQNSLALTLALSTLKERKREQPFERPIFRSCLLELLLASCCCCIIGADCCIISGAIMDERKKRRRQIFMHKKSNRALDSHKYTHTHTTNYKLYRPLTMQIEFLEPEHKHNFNELQM